MDIYEQSAVVKRAVDSLIDGSIANDPDSHRVFIEIYNSLLTGDWRKPDYYFNLYELENYIARKLDAIYDTRDELKFYTKCLRNTVNAGKFSSDRTICEYAKEIWDIKPINVNK